MKLLTNLSCTSIWFKEWETFKEDIETKKRLGAD